MLVETAGDDRCWQRVRVLSNRRRARLRCPAVGGGAGSGRLARRAESSDVAFAAARADAFGGRNSSGVGSDHTDVREHDPLVASHALGVGSAVAEAAIASAVFMAGHWFIGVSVAMTPTRSAPDTAGSFAALLV